MGDSSFPTSSATASHGDLTSTEQDTVKVMDAKSIKDYIALPYRYTRSKYDELDENKKKQVNRVTGILLALLYIEIISLFMPLRPDHAFVALLIIALFFGDAIQFLKYWSPFIFLWVTYDMFRGIADNIGARVHVKSIYDAEILVTGWFTGGKALPFMLQEFKFQHQGEFIVTFLDIVAGLYYGNHFTGPILLAWLFYWNVDDKTEFKRLVFTFAVTSYAAFITFVVIPAAPPWYVWNKGGPLRFTPPKTTEVDIGGLVDFDKITGVTFFTTTYNMFNANPYAAVPSLHGGYSFIAAIFAIRKWGKKASFMVLWPLGMWFSAMWLNHHYLIDLLLGMIYTVFFYFLSLIIFKHQIPPKGYEDTGQETSEKAESQEEES